jgi:hypothetical protein
MDHSDAAHIVRADSISGIYNMDQQTTTKRILWVLAVPITIWWSLSVFSDRPSGVSAYNDFLYALGVIIVPIAGGALVIYALYKVFQPNGVSFDGFMVTDSGYQLGKLRVTEEAKTPGTSFVSEPLEEINKWAWEPKGNHIDEEELLVTVAIRVEKSGEIPRLEYETMAIASEQKGLLEVIGISNINFCGIDDNRLDMMGSLSIENPIGSLVRDLKQIHSIMSKYTTAKSLLFTLLINPEKTSMTPMTMFSLLGGVFVAASNSYKRKQLNEQFKSKLLFGKKDTEYLIGFSEEYGWFIKTA